MCWLSVLSCLNPSALDVTPYSTVTVGDGLETRAPNHMLPPESVDVAPNHISLAKEGQRVMPSFMEMGKHVLMVGHENPLRIKVVTSDAAITGTCLKIKRNSEEYVRQDVLWMGKLPPP